MKKFSIITLTLNSQNTIAENLDSVDSQDYKNIEHICFDSKSTDKTYEILKSYKSKKRKVFQTKKKGLYRCLNQAIKNSTGEYIGVLHSDDVFYNKKILKKIAEKLKNNKTNIVYTDIKIVKKDNINDVIRYWISNSKIFQNKNKKKKCYIRLLKKGWMPPHTGFFIKRKIFNKFKYNLKYSISSDYDFMIKALKSSDGIYYLPITSVLMRIGGKSTKFSSILTKFKEDLDIIKKNDLGGYFTLFKKIFSKIRQFYIK